MNRRHLRARHSVFAIIAVVLASVGVAVPMTANAATPALVVDAAAGNHPISDGIYGMNSYLQDPALAAELRVPVNRFGGDSITTFDYQNGTSNAAENYWFLNGPGPSPYQLVTRDQFNGLGTLVALPTMGWVSNGGLEKCSFSIAKYGHQFAEAPPNESATGCGDGYTVNPCPTGMDFDEQSGICHTPDYSSSQPGTRINNDPTDAGVCPGGRPNPTGDKYLCNAPASLAKSFVASIVAAHGTAAAGGVGAYDLDNEPDLWNFSHHDFHPATETYGEVVGHDRAVAAAIKSADPTAEVWGPSESSYLGYFDLPGNTHCDDPSAYSADRKNHGNAAFSAWFLQQMKNYESTNHTRILDVFDQHYYPSADNVAVVLDNGLAATRALRLRSTRSLWDSTYKDESWISGSCGDTYVNLLPRMRAWRNTYYPGTKLALGEYNFGALNTINGALAQADALGIFAREGIDDALLWIDPSLPSTWPGAYAFRMFRNYDGHCRGFGDTWVQSYSGDLTHQSGQGQLAVYGAKRGADGALTVTVINKTGSSLTTALTLKNFSHASAAKVYRYSAANTGAIQHVADQAVAASGFTATYPANSITLFSIPAAGTKQSPSVCVKTAPDPVAAGGAVTLTATMDPVPPAGESMTFKDGTTTLGTAAISSTGVATFKTSALAVGRHSITATYPGDTTLGVATSSPTGEFVSNTTTTLSSSANPVTAGNNVTFTATVAAVAPTTGSPVGKVTFMDGKFNVLGVVNVVSGKATWTTQFWDTGSHAITATYTSTSSTYKDSKSAVLSQSVN